MNGKFSKLRSLDEALSDLLQHASPLTEIEQVSTFDADGRVLAADLVSGLQVPPQDNSAMDGYALRCADVTAPGSVLQVTQRIPAGSIAKKLEAFSAARIFTGASIPDGADAVVMQEDCELVNDCEGGVRVNRLPKPGQWIRRSGEDVRKNSIVLSKGELLNPAAIGLAASIGMSHLPVRRSPKVALFSTGDELVMPGEVLPQNMKPGSIYNSNRFFLRALLRRLGCEVTDYGIVPDQRQATIEALQTAAAHHDLILTSGGVSVGEEDHIKPAVQALGELELWQIAIKPGKPFAYGKVHLSPSVQTSAKSFCHFAGLPGNPVSSFVTFLLLVRPFLLKIQGAAVCSPKAIPMIADFEWPKADRRREFLRVLRNASGGLDLFPNQSSGVLTSAVWGDGFVDNPEGKTIQKGDTVQYISFSELMS